MEKSPRNILYLTHRDQILGGGEISLHELIKNLNREKYQPFLAMAGGAAMARLAESSGAVPIVMAFPGLHPGNTFKILRALYRLAALALGNKIQILHANTSRAMFYGGLVARLTGRRIIWHVRISEKDPRLDSFLYYLADIVVCNSRATAARFANQEKQNKIRVVHNGLDPEEYRPAPRRRILRHIPEDQKIVLCAGRLEPWKGQDLFLEMAKILKDPCPDARFVLVGEDKTPQGEFLKKLERLVEASGLQGRVHFMGEREDLPALLGEADLVVSTSKMESFGRVLLEAGACQKPVLAFKVGGVAEVVEDGVSGLLTPEGDVKALAEKARALLSNERRRREMGARGRERVLAHFTSALHAKNIEDLYEGLP